MNVGVFVFIKVRNPVNHLIRLLSGSAVIQPYQLMPVDPFLQDRKVALNGIHIKCRMSGLTDCRHGGLCIVIGQATGFYEVVSVLCTFRTLRLRPLTFSGNPLQQLTHIRLSREMLALRRYQIIQRHWLNTSRCTWKLSSMTQKVKRRTWYRCDRYRVTRIRITDQRQ